MVALGVVVLHELAHDGAQVTLALTNIGASLGGPAGDPARTPLRGAPVLSNLSTVRPLIRRDATRRTGLFEPSLAAIRRVLAIPASQLS
jgi:hypothetical protein